MLCEKCKTNNATYHSTVNINGIITKCHLCNECATSESKIKTMFNLGDFFTTSLLSDSNFFDTQVTPSKLEDELKCEQCKLTYSEFLQTGLLGCAQCYKTFYNNLVSIIKNIQPDIKHTGKKLEFYENWEGESANIKKLEFKLKQAVANENYELASEIKKKISELKSNLGGNNNE